MQAVATPFQQIIGRKSTSSSRMPEDDDGGLTWSRKARMTMHIDAIQPDAMPAALRPAVARTPLRSPVAARVAAPVEFESNSVPIQSGSFSMYTRAADQVEAAINSQLGRQVDVRA